MSTEVDVFQSGAIATTSRRDDGFTANITGSSITSKRISIRNNVFRLVVNGKEIDKSEARHLDIVIVNAYVCLAKSNSDDSKRAIQLTVNVNKEEDEEANSQPAPAPQAKREADPFPKVEAIEEEDIPEPVKRAEPKTEPKPQPVQQPKADINDVSLDDLVSDWS
jgi:hypothetical protein